MLQRYLPLFFLVITLEAFTQEEFDVQRLKIITLKYSSSNIDSCHYYANLGITNSRYVNDLFSEGVFYHYISIAEHNSRHFSLSLKFAKKAILCFRKCNQTQYLGKVLVLCASNQYFSDEFSKSIITYDKAHQFAVIHNDSVLQKEVLVNQSLVYTKQGEYSRAMKNQIRAYSISEQLFDTISMASINNAVAALLIRQYNFKEAKPYLQRAIDQYSSINNKEALIAVYTNLADTYEGLGLTNKANEFLLKAFDLATEINDSSSLIMTLLNIGNNFLDQEDYSRAFTYLNRAEDSLLLQPHNEYKRRLHLSKGKCYLGIADYESAIIESSKYEETLLLCYNDPYEYLEYLSILCQAYEQLEKKDDAIKCWKLYSSIKDSAFEITKARKIAELDFKFSLNEKQRELNLYKINSPLKDQEIRKVENENFILKIIIGLIIVSCCIVGHFFVLYKKTRKLEIALLLEQQTNNKDRLEKSQVRRESIAEIRGQEYVKEEIAKELHDGVVGLVYGAWLRLASYLAVIPKNEELDSLAEELRTIIRDARALSRRLNKPKLQKESFRAEISDFVKQFSEASSTCFSFDSIASEAWFQLSIELQLDIFRIVQEAVLNIHKHAKAQSAEIILFIEDNSVLNLIIEDDGVGFVYDVIESGSGIQNMRIRVQKHKGLFDIDSPEDGTIINIRIPINLLK